jgi:hypothetical protein
MKLIMLPLLFSVAYIGFEHKDEIADLYRAAYPADPVKREAIEQCAQSPNFNRLDTADRERCYAGTWGSIPVALAPSPSPYYAYSASHLPGNDIRRQEANDSYRLAGLISSASAAPSVPNPVNLPSPAHQPAAAAHRAPRAHYAAATAKRPVAATSRAH